MLTQQSSKLKGTYLQKMTDKDFYDFCQANEGWNFERDAHKNILLEPPTGSLTSTINNNINYHITHWNRIQKTGKVFDSNGGFSLPDGSQRAADASWVSNKQWNQLSKEEKEVFAPICPEFVVELRSKNDALTTLQEKMEMWITNGTLLAWLIDPKEEKCYVYRANGSIEIIVGFDNKLNGESVLVGFELDLKEILE